MRSGFGGWWIALGVGLAMAGCADHDSGEGEKIGRYRIVASGVGFEVRESGSLLARFVAALFGQAQGAKLRVEAQPLPATDRASNDFRADQIASAVVERLKLVGPAAKPTAMKMPWGVRLLAPDGSRLSPVFRFRQEAEANRFAAAIDARLRTLR